MSHIDVCNSTRPGQCARCDREYAALVLEADLTVDLPEQRRRSIHDDLTRTWLRRAA